MASGETPVPVWLPPDIHLDKAFTHKYQIEREIGAGGMGLVVAARHLELDEPVAIKFLLPGSDQSPEAVVRFRREARAAIRIKNEHVVRIIDTSATESGVPYIVMEYLEGTDLERMLDRLDDRRLPLGQAIEFILQACEAVAEGHRLGIVHRDLKPSNLFCMHGADGLPLIKVLDFGISKLSCGLTDTGDGTDRFRVLGSPRYMSPEQIDSAGDVDPRADVWAFGVMLYEFLTGNVPFADTSMPRLWDHIRTGKHRPARELRHDVPAALDRVIDTCLEKARDQRYPDLAELARALAPFAPERSRFSVNRIIRTLRAPGVLTGALDLPAPTSDPTAVLSLRPRGRRAGAIALLSAAVAALAALLVLWTGRRSAPLRDTPVVAAPAAPAAMTDTTRLSPALPEPVAAPEPAPAPSPAPRRASSPRASAAPSASVAPAPVAAPAPSSSPWIVEITEQRKKAK